MLRGHRLEEGLAPLLRLAYLVEGKDVNTVDDRRGIGQGRPHSLEQARRVVAAGGSEVQEPVLMSGQYPRGLADADLRGHAQQFGLLHETGESEVERKSDPSSSQASNPVTNRRGVKAQIAHDEIGRAHV